MKKICRLISLFLVVISVFSVTACSQLANMIPTNPLDESGWGHTHSGENHTMSGEDFSICYSVSENLYSEMSVAYGEYFSLPVPQEREDGMRFVGYEDDNGLLYTDEYGRSLAPYFYTKTLLLRPRMEAVPEFPIDVTEAAVELTVPAEPSDFWTDPPLESIPSMTVLSTEAVTSWMPPIDFTEEIPPSVDTPVEADPNSVYWHTPAFDGRLDDAYLKSFSFTTDYLRGGMETSRHTAYVLWDGEYIYVAVVIDDNDLMSRGLDYINAINQNGYNYPWGNDCVEIWYAFDGVIPVERGLTRMVGYDMMGIASGVYTDAASGNMSCHISDCDAKATYVKNYHVDDPDNYVDRSVIEFKIPAKDERGEYREIEDDLWFAIQVNDIEDGEGDPRPENTYGCVWGKGARTGLPSIDMKENNCWSVCYLSDIRANQVVVPEREESTEEPDLPQEPNVSTESENHVHDPFCECVKFTELYHIYWHKPEFDGRLDEEYLKSFSFSTDYLRDGTETSRHTAYALWDGEYLYVAVVIDDNDLLSSGFDYINSIDETGDNHPFFNDCVEIWYAFEGVIPDTPDKTRMIGYDMLGVGTKHFTDYAGGFRSDHFEECDAKATYVLDFNPSDPDGYVDRAVVEFKIPTKLEGRSLGLDCEDEVWLAIQINDIVNLDERDGPISDPDFFVWSKGAQNGLPSYENGKGCWEVAILSDTRAANIH